MRIIISPAKKMRENEDAVPAGQLGTPVFLDRAEELCAWMSGLSYEEQRRVVQKGVYVKMARGEMVRYLASVHAEVPEQMRDFSWSGYRFCEERSGEREYVFVRAR